MALFALFKEKELQEYAHYAAWFKKYIINNYVVNGANEILNLSGNALETFDI